jgi:glycosyltransferase involved in cell wall biosynthesis
MVGPSLSSTVTTTVWEVLLPDASVTVTITLLVPTFEQSNADYIAYVDGDDYWIDDRKLKTQIDYLDSNLDYSMCFCGYWNQQNLDKSSLHLKSWYGPNFDDIDEFLPSHFIMTNPVNSLTRVFRNIKGIFKDYFFECHINDLPLHYELSKVGKIKFLNVPAGVYRVHDKPNGEKLVALQNVCTNFGYKLELDEEGLNQSYPLKN